MCVSGSLKVISGFPSGQTPDVSEKSSNPKVEPLTRSC